MISIFSEISFLRDACLFLRSSNLLFISGINKMSSTDILFCKFSRIFFAIFSSEPIILPNHNTGLSPMNSSIVIVPPSNLSTQTIISVKSVKSTLFFRRLYAILAALGVGSHNTTISELTSSSGSFD